jgi:hypothetical protein
VPIPFGVVCARAVKKVATDNKNMPVNSFFIIIVF